MSLLVDTGVWSLASRREAAVRNTCRRHGVQIGTIDAVLIQLALKHDLVLLSTDIDFRAASKHIKFRLWRAQL